MDIIFPTINVLLLCFYTSGLNNDGCGSPQYLEIGETGVVQCSFQRSFYGVLWFHSAQEDRETPFIKLLNSEKSGDGYLSGEYDVYRDGSLVINYVTHIYDRNFTVAKVDSLEEEPVTYDITVITTVKPRRGHPQIDRCGNDNRSCAFLQTADVSTISCSIGPSRPVIELKWFLRTGNEEKVIQFESSLTGDGVTYTSHAVITDSFPDQSFLNLLICRANSLPGMLREKEAFVVLENRQIAPSNVQSRQTWVKRGSTLKLPCLGKESNIIIWKRLGKWNESLDIMAYAIFSERILNSFDDEHTLDIDGSLAVPKVAIENEGIYECSSEDYGTGVMDVYKVMVYVPASPVVRGCVPNLTCALDVPEKGQLICDVVGIRPVVQLEWNLVYEHDSNYITFTSNEVTTTQTGDIYDITLSSNFRIHDADWVFVLAAECVITDTSIKDLMSATTVVLMPKTFWGSDVPFYVALGAYVAVVLLLLLGIQIIVHLMTQRNQQEGDQNNSDDQNNHVEEEGEPLNVLGEGEGNQDNPVRRNDEREEERGAANSNGKELTFKQAVFIRLLYMVYLFIIIMGLVIVLSMLY